MTGHAQPVLYSVDLTGCTALASLSPDSMCAAFARALRGAGGTVVQSVAHDFSGAGLTCVLILAESHAVLHTWPETGTVNIDIFSCSPKLQSLAAIDEIGLVVGATTKSVREIPRTDGHDARAH